VLVTGGLGSTDDDMTNEAVSKALNRPTLPNLEVLSIVRTHLDEISPAHVGQLEKLAWLPEGAEVLNPQSRMAGYQLIHDENEPDNTAALLAEIQNRAGDYIYEIGPRNMPAVVKDLLSEQNKTISFAESCTAGLVAATFGEISGVSAVFKGSMVAYANEVKVSQLHVPADVLAEFGAVSEETAVAMAKGCRDVMKTDLAVSITGIAGPDGGTADKPVGLVYLAVASERGVDVRRMQIPGNRARVRKVATLNAFDLARRELLR